MVEFEEHSGHKVDEVEERPFRRPPTRIRCRPGDGRPAAPHVPRIASSARCSPARQGELGAGPRPAAARPWPPARPAAWSPRGSPLPLPRGRLRREFEERCDAGRWTGPLAAQFQRDHGSEGHASAAQPLGRQARRRCQLGAARRDRRAIVRLPQQQIDGIEDRIASARSQVDRHQPPRAAVEEVARRQVAVQQDPLAGLLREPGCEPPPRA